MTKKDLAHLKEIENSTRDVIRSHADIVDAGGFLRLSVRVIKENEWLCKQLRAALRGKEVEEDAEETEPAAV